MICHLATACQADKIVNLFVWVPGLISLIYFIYKILMFFVNMFANGFLTRCSVQGCVGCPRAFLYFCDLHTTKLIVIQAPLNNAV